MPVMDALFPAVAILDKPLPVFTVLSLCMPVLPQLTVGACTKLQAEIKAHDASPMPEVRTWCKLALLLTSIIQVLRLSRQVSHGKLARATQQDAWFVDCR